MLTRIWAVGQFGNLTWAFFQGHPIWQFNKQFRGVQCTLSTSWGPRYYVRGEPQWWTSWTILFLLLLLLYSLFGILNHVKKFNSSFWAQEWFSHFGESCLLPGSSQTDLYWSQLAVFLSPEEQQWDNSAISSPFKDPQTKLSKLPSTQEILKMINFGENWHKTSGS